MQFFTDPKKNAQVHKNVIKAQPAKQARRATPDDDSSEDDRPAGKKKKGGDGKGKTKDKKAQRRQYEKDRAQEELDELSEDDEAPKARKKRAPISADKLLAREIRYDEAQWTLLQELLEERPKKPRDWANYDDDEKKAWRHKRDLGQPCRVFGASSELTHPRSRPQEQSHSAKVRLQIQDPCEDQDRQVGETRRQARHRV